MHGESRSDGVSMELPYTKKQKIPATTTKVCQVNHQNHNSFLLKLQNHRENTGMSFEYQMGPVTFAQPGPGYVVLKASEGKPAAKAKPEILEGSDQAE